MNEENEMESVETKTDRNAAELEAETKMAAETVEATRQDIFTPDAVLPKVDEKPKQPAPKSPLIEEIDEIGGEKIGSDPLTQSLVAVEVALYCVRMLAAKGERPYELGQAEAKLLEAKALITRGV